MQEELQLPERQLVEMLTFAGEYCIMMEKLENVETFELNSFLQKIGPVLYLKGLLFPEITEPEEEEGDERFVTEEQWERVFTGLRNHFGESDQFKFQDPGSEDAEMNSLAELYADVYQDLKDFAWLMTKNTQLARSFAAFNIRKYFNSNWGYKLLKAQLVLHSRLIKQVDAEGYDELDF